MLQLKLAEKKKIDEAASACGLRSAVWAREKILKGRFPEPKAARLDLYTYTELKKIGVNLNQLTRLANGGHLSPQLIGTLVRLEQKLDAITAKLVYDR
ncbi:MobC family plasmid mobilization relaxosome protein [Mucilaginibacter yixingensis]|nr:MobC family plasmid mobilization relaxosome protein [Mucilaginibacter yixingensis]